jgi:hypothetical protein
MIKKISLRSFLYSLAHDINLQLTDGTKHHETLEMVKRRIKRLEEDTKKNYIKLID